MLRVLSILVLLTLWTEDSLQNTIPLKVYDTVRDGNQTYDWTQLPDQRISLDKDVIDNGDRFTIMETTHNQGVNKPTRRHETFLSEDINQPRPVQNMNQNLPNNTRRGHLNDDKNIKFLLLPVWAPRPTYNNEIVLLGYKKKKRKPPRPPGPPKPPKPTKPSKSAKTTTEGTNVEVDVRVELKSNTDPPDSRETIPLTKYRPSVPNDKSSFNNHYLHYTK